MRFSIIVPVYNVEKYLETCLNSILNQNYNEFELILVNDGSTDNSGLICQNYYEKFENIKYIIKENGGLSSARNEGILRSQGEYIIFTDSDDYWKGNNVLFDLNEIIIKDNPDLILHEETRFFSEENQIYECNINKIKSEEHKFMEDCFNLIYNEVYVASAWDKVIKREILINNNLFFPLKRKSEDIEWCAKLIEHINKYSLFYYSFYIYRQSNTNSITKNIDSNHILDIFQMIKICLNEGKKKNKTIQRAIENFLTINYVVLLMNYYKLTKTDRTLIKTEIFEWKFLLLKNANIRVDRIIKISENTNFHLMIIMLNLYRKINNYLKGKVFFGRKVSINK